MSATYVVRVNVVAFDMAIVGALAVDVVAIGAVAIGVVAIGVVAIGGVEVDIEAETGVGSSLFALVDAVPVVMRPIFSLIYWMMRSTMSRRAMVLGGTR